MNDEPEAKRPVGRPSKFNDQIARKIIELAEDGRTEYEIAEIVGIGVRTLQVWKKEKFELSVALREAKLDADALVEASLFHRACGYSHPAVKVFCHEGEITEHTYTEHYPPDTQAIKFWLMNRQPRDWRERKEISGPDGGPITVASLTPEERKAMIAKLDLEAEELGDE